MIMYNADNSGILASGPTYYSSSTRKYFKWYKNCDIEVNYDNAATSQVTDIRDNNLFCVAISNISVSTLQVNTRIRYTDI